MENLKLCALADEAIFDIEHVLVEKFKVIEISLRHSRTLGGGHHCVTNDLERQDV